MEKKSKIFVAGHRGLVGSAVVRKLSKDGYTNILTRSRPDLDLRVQKDVDEFFHCVGDTHAVHIIFFSLSSMVEVADVGSRGD